MKNPSTLSRARSEQSASGGVPISATSAYEPFVGAPRKARRAGCFAFASCAAATSGFRPLTQSAPSLKASLTTSSALLYTSANLPPFFNWLPTVTTNSPKSTCPEPSGSASFIIFSSSPGWRSILSLSQIARSSPVSMWPDLSWSKVSKTTRIVWNTPPTVHPSSALLCIAFLNSSKSIWPLPSGSASSMTAFNWSGLRTMSSETSIFSSSFGPTRPSLLAYLVKMVLRVLSSSESATPDSCVDMTSELPRS